jgi:anti-sigma factor RsiW
VRDPRPHRRHPHEDERLSAFLDDELDDDDALEVTRHLAGCDPCLGELEHLRDARSLLRGLPNLEPPAALFSEAVATASLERLRWSRTVRVASVALAGTALISAAAFVAGADDGGTVVPPVEMFVVDHVVRVGGGPMITPVDLGARGR